MKSFEQGAGGEGADGFFSAEALQAGLAQGKQAGGK